MEIGSGLAGRTAMVTGATSGLGYATAAELGQRDVLVLVHGRTRQTADQAARRLSGLGNAPAGKYVPVYADLTSLEEVRQLTAQVREKCPDGLDILINNAGAQFSSRRLSPEGIEVTTALVHFTPAVLHRLLLDDLRRAADHADAPARVVTVTSVNERFGKVVTDWSYPSGYGQVRAYSNAKLMALAYTYGLARRIDEKEIVFNAAEPGFVFTDFGRKAGGSSGLMDRLLRPVAPVLIASPEKAARRSAMIAADPALA
ncbi:MAG TPA: SDR family NAD(P)-dependent oxidoreductase, partial [Trebonia sp.]|nr:SDR family NAD(P)-dependent oxidoreductase [Trebonia sp.]